MGRINIIKMDILPKILYIFQTVPLVPPKKLMMELRKAIVSFIWAHKTPRIKREILIRNKKNGGLSLPDFTKYLQAASLTSIIDWHHNKETKQWVNLEEELIGPQLRFLPWIKPHLRPKKKELTIFVNATLKIWDTIIKRGKLSTMTGPMTPLFSNPEFPPALETTNYLKWNILENARVEQILVDGKLPKLQDLGKWLQYYQLNTFIELKIPLINRPKTKFEKILVEEQEPTKK